MNGQTKKKTDGILLKSLINDLFFLRASWQRHWFGLPFVFKNCVQMLGFEESKNNSRLNAIRFSAQEVAQSIEADGAHRALTNEEPHYHNRLHIADTLVCMCHLLLAYRSINSEEKISEIHEWIAMFAMLGHDYLHTGGVNTSPAELESRSVELLNPIMQRNYISKYDQELICYCILKTDPKCTPLMHSLVKNKIFDIRDKEYLAVLVEEADILASTLPETSNSLTESLAKEWRILNLKDADNLTSNKGRLIFLEKQALFSSSASIELGMLEIREREIQNILSCGYSSESTS
jgi:hypothetical protein